ncbi:hypothetical protein [Micromonospora sediminimaris]|uniref:Uncharacterized protein n=1 Tax=Micromonospora sediminimaris TaxID=547162 RepID=A0A9W5XKR3_9ACTN|nr:hypothetical protein [Micromonospora sediminimaris]GIJ34247.1 hypothetical protein Vse01_33950 [Micromonospora sediminimaris]SFC97599.1 hypothetical protein SAMN05216284_109136 [Micromonospora sediminimaris]
MARRVVVALLAPVAWTPPGVDPVDWRSALAEDVVDLLAMLNEVDTAVAVTRADRWLADAVIWPGTTVYEVPEPSPNAVFAALTGARGPAGTDPATGAGPADGTPATVDSYEQVAVVAGDAPDLPGLTVGKLLRPLTSRPVAVAPAEGGLPGLLGVAARLPVPSWLPPLDMDATVPAAVRAAAPRPGDLAVTPSWHRLRGPADLARLDPALDGWEHTRSLLSGAGRSG